MRISTRLPLERPGLTTLLVGVVTLLLGAVAAFGIRIDNGIEAFLPRGDEELARYESFRAIFGEDNFLVVALEGIDLDDEVVAGAAAELQHQLQELSEVGGVFGPFTKAPESSILPGGSSQPALRLIAEDRRACAFLVRPATRIQNVSAMFDQVQEHLRASRFHGQVRIAGPLAINHYMDKASNESFGRLFPIVVLLIGLVLFAVLHSVSLVLGILLVAAVASVWTVGLLVLSGQSFNMVVSVIPALLVVLGPAYSLHLDQAFRVAHAATPKERWHEAIKDTFRPCFMTAVTTAAGLAALAFAEIVPVRNLGLFGALGVLISFLLVFTFLPASQLLLGARRTLAEHGPKVPGRAPPLRVVEWLLRARWPILASSVALAVVSCVGISRISVESHILSFFAEEHELVRATRAIEESITGLTPIEVWLSGSEEDLFSVEAIAASRDLEQVLLEQPHVTGLFGPMFGASRPGSEKIDLRWTVATKTTSIETSEALLNQVEQEVQQRLPGDATVCVTGSVPILIRLQALLLRTQIRTFVVSMLIVTTLLALAFRSLRLALLSLIPNLLPILITLGGMGFLGIPLNVATVTVASIALGLVVDDTIHFLDRYDRSRGSGRTTVERLGQVFRAVSRPILFTSIATAAGFAAFTQADFQPTFYFGLLIAGTAILALACDLVVLPALILVKR